MRKVQICFQAFLVCIYASGCAKPEPPKPALISITKPDFANTTEFILPAGGPQGKGQIPSIGVRLPKGTSFAGPFVFKTPDGEVVDVRPQEETDQFKQHYSDLQAATGKPLTQDIFLAGDWLGTLQKLSSGSAGTDYIYSMCSKQAAYELQITCPNSQDPTAIAQDVLCSYKELK